MKLTPTIVFEGKTKDKIPAGEGILKYGEYWTISGVFDGENIKNARVNGFGFGNKTAYGDFRYTVSYDSKGKKSTMDLKIVDITVDGIHIINGPEIEYRQYKKEEINPFFNSQEIFCPYFINPERWSWAKNLNSSVVKNSIFNFGYDFKLTPVGFTLKDGFVVKGNEYAFTITSPNGSTVSYKRVNEVPSFSFNLRDGGKLNSTKVEEIRHSQYLHAKIEKNSEWKLLYPDGDVFEGTLLSLNNVEPEKIINKHTIADWSGFIDLIKEIENGGSKDVMPYNGFIKNGEQTVEHFQNGLSDSRIQEIRNSQPKIIEVKKAGTLLSYISPEELKTVQNLSIIGYLDERDLKIITELGKELVKLDLSLAYTTLSKEARTEQAANDAALLSLFGLMGVMVDSQYNDYNISTSDYLSVKSFATIAQQAASEVKVADKKCIIPSEVLCRMPKLVEVRLPIWCSKIGASLNSLQLLQYVILPPKLQTIDEAFKDCPNLRTIDFPSTLQDIEKKAFNGTILESVDLSDCNWYRFGDLGLPYRSFPTQHKVLWQGIPVAKELRLPKNVDCLDGLGLRPGGTLYCPSTLEYSDVGMKGLTLYCQSSTPFKLAQNGSINDCTLYVPKGSITAWYAAFGKKNKIIEQ